MNWLKDLIFGNDEPSKQAISQPHKEDPQTRYLRDSLSFAKQQHKDLLLYRNKQERRPKECPQDQNLRDTLTFAKQQSKELQQKQNEHERWQDRYGSLHVEELKQLSGIEFEDYLVKLFTNQGYRVEKTPVTGDYGADLILHKDQYRVAIQAKCYSGSVGVSAVQEALSGMAYYRCQNAWVVTTGNYTTNAMELARQSNIRLIGRNELGKFIMQMQNGR